ncbi:MAG: TetR/AcrR family transcriptional regulator [Gaiellaceae bacterium]
MTPGGPRLPAGERRAAVLEAACLAFAQGSYRGTTTAEIGRAAGVSEPILYRHFSSKRDLYLACLDSSWQTLRRLWDATVAAEPEPSDWVSSMGRAYLAQRQRIVLVDLWIQSLGEAAEDVVIRKFLRRQIREVHAYVAGTIERAQAAGGLARDRDPVAEAWIFLSLGLLASIDGRLGPLLGDDLERVIRERRRWMTAGS